MSDFGLIEATESGLVKIPFPPEFPRHKPKCNQLVKCFVEMYRYDEQGVP